MPEYKKWEIVLASLEPTRGSEISKTRPCLIVSPNKINIALNVIIIVPLTSTIKKYTSRLSVNHRGRVGSLAFDQIRAIDKSRVIKKDGNLSLTMREKVNTMLQIMFSEP